MATDVAATAPTAAPELRPHPVPRTFGEPLHPVRTLSPRPRRSAVWRSLRRRGKSRRIVLRPGWPLLSLYGLYPLWWLSGFAVVGFFFAAVPMALHLAARRVIRVPRGFGAWLLFLLWVAAGATVLWVDAPGAIPVHGPGRLVSFAYYLGWYLIATIILLYVGSFREEELPTRKVVRLMGWMFGVTVAGGYLGALLPTLGFSSLLEVALPQSIASNAFLNVLIHPQSAQVQDILGYDSPRAKAPFLYANDWGANYGLLLPFFVLLILGPYALRRWRAALLVVALVAVPPIVFSLNRGLWLGLTAMAGYVLLRLVLRGRLVAVGAVVAVVGLGLAVASVTPLGALFVERLAHPHSDEGRGQLVSRSVSSALHLSPIVGYGGTRGVQGNFFSIAGSRTAECPQCSPPQLGTQGHLWFLVFTSGLGGTVLFIGFVYYRYHRALRDPSPLAFALCAGGVFFGVVMLVYDLVGTPLAVVMVALGLLWRNEAQRRASSGGTSGASELAAAGTEAERVGS